MDGPNRVTNTELAVQYCMKHPLWRLSLQTHKIVGIR
jgi:7-carboxy-7-deazaguanine synthase